MDLDNIEIGKKEISKLIGAAKRVWTGAKTERVAVDKIERAESALFANDLTLARLAKQKTLLDTEITNHIDKVLEESRGYNQSVMVEKKETALRDLLKDAQHEFSSTNGLWASDSVGEIKENHFQLKFDEINERLENMIKDLEEGGI